MPWNRNTATSRIQDTLKVAPVIEVQRFNEYLPIHDQRMALAETAKKGSSTPPLFALPKGSAVVVESAHIYAAITNYDEYRLIEGVETEASHERALRLLHLYYTVADRVIGSTEAQRVDFHNGRVHAVILETNSEGLTENTVSKAFSFVDDLNRAVERANSELAGSEFPLNLRFGIDMGTCVAINNGTGAEQEPMFLGSAANHAAKLAFGSEPGVYASERVRVFLGYQGLGGMGEALSIEGSEVDRHAQNAKKFRFGLDSQTGTLSFAEHLVEDMKSSVRKGELPDYSEPSFNFSYKEPPLKTLKYRDLSPSRSIRMDMVSMFADLTGYTKYIDSSVAKDEIHKAVRALYVIRQELQDVVEKDFGGRKVRFIGDCIHALIAEGDRNTVDAKRTVSSAAQCAGGLQSSFEICKSVLDGTDSLGLAIGIELGPTPVSRIGIRGDRAVRIASSVATAMSEKMQRGCDGTGVIFGPKAMQAGPAGLTDLHDNSGFSEGYRYDEVATCLSVSPIEVQTPNYVRAHVGSDKPMPRAHLKSQ